MPETPATAQADAEGTDGSSQNEEYNWTKLATSIPDEQTVRTSGSGSNVGNPGSFDHQTGSTGAAYGGSILPDLSKISPTPFSDAISEISSAVYSTTKSAVSSLGGGGKSGGGSGGNLFEGLGSAFANLGPGDGRYNPDSKNYRGNKSSSNVDANGKIKKNKNGNVSRKGTSAPAGGGADR